MARKITKHEIIRDHDKHIYIERIEIIAGPDIEADDSTPQADKVANAIGTGDLLDVLTAFLKDAKSQADVAFDAACQKADVVLTKMADGLNAGFDWVTNKLKPKG